jgi:tetratricopeptide (TPR) repeat protein
MDKIMMLRSILSIFSLCLLLACQQAPTQSRSANPSSSKGDAPFGSKIPNEIVQQKMDILNTVLNGQLPPQEFESVLKKKLPSMSTEQWDHITSVSKQFLQEIQTSGRQFPLSVLDQDFIRGQIYFADRRFIEAAHALSKVLDANPKYPGARNTLARCFFFLGNPTRTVEELQWVLKNVENTTSREEITDALFLIGAAVVETPGLDKHYLLAARNAWQTYLQMDPQASQKKRIEEGIIELDAALRGEGALAKATVVASQDAVTTGGGTMSGTVAGTNVSSSANTVSRVSQLPTNASSLQKLLAQGGDALDARDLHNAKIFLNEALTIDGKHPEALVGSARIAFQEGRKDEALRIYGEVIQSHPEFMPAWHYQGMAKLMDGSPAEAVRSWEHIVKTDPAYAEKFGLQQRIMVAKQMMR